MESKPTLLAVSNAVRPLTIEQTRQLVLQLGVPLNVLDDVTAQFDGENRKQHFIQKLFDMKGTDWDKIVAGLREIDMNTFATDIERAHISKAPVLLPTSKCVSAPTSPVEMDGPASNTTTNFATPHSSVAFLRRVDEAKGSIEHFEEAFSKLKSEVRQLLSKKENVEPNFLGIFRDHLLDLPVAKKAVHIKFLKRHEDEILEAKNIQKLFAILGRYCNYSNYEIIFHVVKRFCKGLLKSMTQYRDSLFAFEKATSIDVYLFAISAHPKGKVSEAFIRMALKINKPPSTCSLYEIRQLKELIAENSSVESYAMYVEDPQEGSIHVTLCVPREVGEMVGVVLMDPDFRWKNHITDVTVDNTHLSTYLWGDSALMVAVRWGKAEAILQLLKSGAALDLQNKLGETALIVAHSNEYIFSLLLKAGTTGLNLQDKDGESALIKAAEKGQANVVSLLLQAGAALDLQNKWGYSALMMAVKEDMREVVSLLVNAGASLDLQNNWGDSALMVAVREDRTDIISTLIESGAALDLQNKWGQTALIMAAAFGRNNVVSLLVEAGAALNFQDQWGDFALMMAVRWCTTEVVSQLVETGADVNLQNKERVSVLVAAHMNDRKDVVQLLLKAGAQDQLQESRRLPEALTDQLSHQK